MDLLSPVATAVVTCKLKVFARMAVVLTHLLRLLTSAPTVNMFRIVANQL